MRIMSHLVWGAKGRSARNVGPSLTVLCLISVCCQSVSAQTPAVNIVGAGTLASDASYSMGWTFNVTEAISVTSLGFLDTDALGFANDHPVGIFDSNANLLASTIVTNADPFVPTPGSSFGFRYHDIAPLTLVPASGYVVAAVTRTERYFSGPPGSITVDSRITFVKDSWEPFQTALVFPTRTDGLKAAYFGPNFRTGSGNSAAAPEPGSLSLLALAGLVSLLAGGARIYRRR